jgi:hypothetical protein
MPQMCLAQGLKLRLYLELCLAYTSLTGNNFCAKRRMRNGIELHRRRISEPAFPCQRAGRLCGNVDRQGGVETGEFVKRGSVTREGYGVGWKKRLHRRIDRVSHRFVNAKIVHMAEAEFPVRMKRVADFGDVGVVQGSREEQAPMAAAASDKRGAVAPDATLGIDRKNPIVRITTNDQILDVGIDETPDDFQAVD